MALYGLIRVLSVLLGTSLSFCTHLYECKELDGYEFPVYSTQFCPRNQTEWNERSSAINCTQENGYLCFPNEKFTQLLEFCHRARFIWIQEGYCLYLKKDDSAIYSYSCSSFQSGCHNSSFPSYDLFKHSSCTSIGNGCFLAEPSCKGLPETTKPTHVEIVTRNFSTTASTGEKTNQTLKNKDYFIYDEIFMMPILAGVLIPIIIFCMLCIIYRKEYHSCERKSDVESPGEYIPLFPATDLNKMLMVTNNEEYHICERKSDEESSGEEECKTLLPTTDLNEMPLGTNKEESLLDRAMFEQWQEDNTKFVPTRACKEVEKLIKSQNLVVVTGNSGSGKSAIIQHIALSYRSDNGTVKPVYSVQEIIDAWSQHNDLDKTLLVFNDPIGNLSFDQEKYKLWKDHEEKLKVCLKKIKMLVSCRRYILNDARVRGILKDTSCIIDLNDELHKMDRKEKHKICENYASNSDFLKEDINEIIKTEEYFPLLCKLYFSDENKQKTGLNFFKEPVKVCTDEINYFREECHENYCALILLVLCNNQLCVEDIRNKDLLKEKFKLALELSEMKSETAPHTVVDTFKKLEGFYVKRIGNMYHFYHDFVMEVTTYVLGTDYPAEVIKYADIGFIRRRVQLKCCSNKIDQLTVCLNDNYIYNLVERLLSDISGEKLLDVVLNPCLKNEKVINVFKQIINEHPEKQKWLHEKVVFQRNKQKFHELSHDLWISKLDFLYLENEITPLNALVIFGHTKLALFCLTGPQKNPTKLIDGSLFSAVCCNGSLDLFEMFTEDDIKHFLSMKWGFLYPSYTAAVFYNHEILRELKRAGAIDESNYWIHLQLATENHRLKHKENNINTSKRDITVQFLLSNGPGINLYDSNGTSPLHVACHEGYDNIVQHLLSNGAEINKCTEDGVSPLYIACEKGHKSIVQRLIEFEADISLCKLDGTSPLCMACQNGHEDIIQFLLINGADINYCTEDGTSLLHVACREGREGTVQLLLENGAKTNLVDEDGSSPLYVACEEGYQNIVQLLLNNEADINLCDYEGKSSLYIACAKGHINIVQLLLAYRAEIESDENPLYISCQNGYDAIIQLLLSDGADINRREINGASPFYIACKKGHDSTVQLLLNNGADVKGCKTNGSNPLYIACKNGHEGIVQLLLSKGADINQCKLDGTSPLYIACQNGHESIVQFLLNKGADISLYELYDASPLYIACQNGHKSIVQLLLNHGAGINKCEQDGTNPLYLACQLGHDTTVELLLNNGANVNLCKEDGTSPLFIACQEGHDNIVQLLLTFGANVNLCKEDRTSPLYIACQEGHDNIVKLLLTLGANVNLYKIDGTSPLYIASQNRHKRTEQILLNNGAGLTVAK